MATLFAAKGGSSASDLYIVDPVTVAVTSIGPIGFAVTGLAFDPTDGTLYGVTGNNDPTHPVALITIDPSTGAGTLVADMSLGPVADISFRSDGTLFGWTESSDDACTINKTTGVVTVLGNAGIISFGDGNSFTSADVWYGAFRGDQGRFNTVNQTTGALTNLAFLSGGPYSGSASVSAAAFDESDVFWAIFNNTGTGSCALVTVSTSTSVVSTVGFFAGAQWDALAWQFQITDIVLTPSCGVAGTSVSVDGTGFDLSAALSATFNGSPLTLSGTTTTDGAGAFTGSLFTAPALAPGTYVVRFDSVGGAYAQASFTTTPANSSCVTSMVLQTGGCVTVSNVCVANTGPDPLDALLGTGGGHALWFVYTLPAFGPSGADVTWTITPGTLGAYNAGVVSGPCGSGTIQTQTGSTVQTTLAQSVRPFTGSTSGRSTTTQAVGVAAPATSGSYVQDATGETTITAHANSGETVHLEVDNYGGSAQGDFTVCVGFSHSTPPVLTFDTYFRAEQ